MRFHFISTNPAHWGGSEELWHSIALQALSEGHKVLVSVFRDPAKHPKVRQLQAHGAILDIRHPPCYHLGQPLQSLMLAQLADRLNWNQYAIAWTKAIRFQADAILVSSGEALDGYLFDDAFLILEARRRGIPYLNISHFHYEHSKILPKALREKKGRFLEQSAAALFVSLRNLQMTRSELQHPLPGARIIHNPFSVAASRGTRLERGDTIRMAFVARLECDVKCQDLIVQALAHPSFRDIAFSLDLYGGGRDAGYLESLIAYHGLSEKIRLMGYHTDPARIWDDHEILVLTSRAEGTPLTLFEAMREGRTAIVTHVGDSPLWMAEGRGYVSPAATVESIQETLQHAIADRHSWENKGEQCRRYFLSKWNGAHADQILGAMKGSFPAQEIGWDSESYSDHLKAFS